MGREGERAGAGSDLEGCESRGSSLAGVEELAVGGYVEIRRPGFAVEAEGQRIDRLFFVEPPFAGIVIESDERAIELVQEVDGPAVRVKSEMPRPGLFLDLRGRWIICRELACRGIETVLVDDVPAEACGKDEAIFRVRQDGMRVRGGFDDLMDGTDLALRVYRAHRNFVPPVRGAEQIIDRSDQSKYMPCCLATRCCSD